MERRRSLHRQLLLSFQVEHLRADCVILSWGPLPSGNECARQSRPVRRTLYSPMLMTEA